MTFVLARLFRFGEIWMHVSSLFGIKDKPTTIMGNVYLRIKEKRIGHSSAVIVRRQNIIIDNFDIGTLAFWTQKLMKFKWICGSIIYVYHPQDMRLYPYT